VWVREDPGDWTYNISGNTTQNWACINLAQFPAFVAPGNDVSLNGRSYDENGVQNQWFNANAGGSGNLPGLFDESSNGGNSGDQNPFYYFSGNSVWICTWSSFSPQIDLGSGSSHNSTDNICRTSP
jgi:hypothetical protein